MRVTPHPVVDGLSLHPYPGNDGATTWKASAGSPPCARGSVSGPSTARNSSTDPGHPWVSTSGNASGSGERTCRKWMPSPSMVARYCAKSFSTRTCAHRAGVAAYRSRRSPRCGSAADSRASSVRLATPSLA
ncbi:Uncharacterised protein [Nocardia brasiliensis]|nr:Uncharacterised protein [Nocardia brasiliensis]